MLALAGAAPGPARAQEFTEFSSAGLPGSRGMVLRILHPATWKKVPVEDELALAELRGPQGPLTGILQIGRGRQRQDTASLCQPGRARTMLGDLAAREPGTRVTDVVARMHQGRAAFELRYERHGAPDFMLVHSLIVCLKDSRVVVSCGGSAEKRSALAAIEPVCRKVLDSLSISEP